MNKKVTLASIGCVLFVAGCATLDDQLNSPDPEIRARAEKNLEGIVLDTNQWTGGAKKEQRIEAIKRIRNQKTLFRILTMDMNDGRFNGEHWDEVFKFDSDVYQPCIDGLDQAGLVAFILHEEQYVLTSHMKKLEKEVRRRAGGWERLPDEDSESYSAELFLHAAMATGRRLDEVLDSRESAIKFCETYNRKRSPRLWYAIGKLKAPEAIALCFSKSQNEDVKFVLFPDVYKNWQYVQDKYELAAILKVACERQKYKQEALKKGSQMKVDAEYVVTDAVKTGIVARIGNQKVFLAMLRKENAEERRSRQPSKNYWFYTQDPGVMKAVAFKMPEEKIFKTAIDCLGGHTISAWNKSGNSKDRDDGVFWLAYAVFMRVTDQTKKNTIANLVADKIEGYYQRCKNERYMIWESEDKEKTRKILDLWGDDMPSEARTRLEKLAGGLH